MTARIELRGSKELAAQLAKMPDEIRDAVGGEIMEVAGDLEAGIKLKIQQGSKTGRIYRRGNVVHQASAPGESPASDTGTLIGSIYHERVTQLSATTGSRLAYANWLEYGTSRMAARPFFRPAVEDMRKDFEGRVTGAMQTAIDRVAR